MAFTGITIAHGPSPHSQQHAGLHHAIGLFCFLNVITVFQSRSESMLSIHSQEGGRYGTVAIRGEIEFGMVYSIHSSSLDLSIKQCRDLAAVDAKRNRSDP